MKPIQWKSVIGAVFGVIAFVAVALGLLVCSAVFRSGRPTYVEVSRVSRPGTLGEAAVLYDASSGGALGATTPIRATVFLATSTDSIPGKSSRLLWQGRTMDVVALAWRGHDSLDVIVKNNDGYQHHKSSIMEKSRKGLRVRTVVD